MPAGASVTVHHFLVSNELVTCPGALDGWNGNRYLARYTTNISLYECAKDIGE